MQGKALYVLRNVISRLNNTPTGHFTRNTSRPVQSCNYQTAPHVAWASQHIRTCKYRSSASVTVYIKHKKMWSQWLWTLLMPQNRQLCKICKKETIEEKLFQIWPCFGTITNSNQFTCWFTIYSIYKHSTTYRKWVLRSWTLMFKNFLFFKKNSCLCQTGRNLGRKDLDVTLTLFRSIHVSRSIMM